MRAVRPLLSWIFILHEIDLRLVKNYLQIDPTHVHPGAQVFGLAGEHMLPQVEVAKAVFGTDSEATIGKATIAATPIFFKTSRLLMPYDGILSSKRFSRFN
jgi:hypothetical protein